MRGSLLLAVLVALLLPGSALAKSPAAVKSQDPPPGAAISDSLDYIGKLPDTDTVIEGKFDRMRGKDLLILDGAWGLKTFDVSDPADPKPLDTFLPPDLKEGGFWEGEDMDIDTERKLVFMSLDPRHDEADPIGTGCPPPRTTRNPNCRSGIYVVSYADPANLRQIGDFVDVPSGHTTSCIQGCRFLWTGGPARRDDLAYLGAFTPGGRGDGRPIWVTDMRNPRQPEVYGQPIDLYRNDGATDYTHDVQVDGEGVAWASGRGGIRGYATRGMHRDPTTNKVRRARPWSPILVAGGGIGGVSTPDSMFMHNSLRPTDGKVHARGVKDGDILVGTEEEFNNRCDNDGRLVFSDLSDSWGGEPALNSTPETPYRMKPISTWHPAIDTPETTAPSTNCSAHYFDIENSTLAQAWYAQGVRVLDILNARFPRQIGYFRVQSDGSPDNPSSVVWDTQFHKGLLWVFDHNRGVEVLRLDEPTGLTNRLASVTAPDMKTDKYAPVPVADPGATDLVCPLFRDSAATKAVKARATKARANRVTWG